MSFADRDVLKSIDVNIGPRDRLAVLGDNGSGKTTLLRLLAGGLTPDRGERVVTVPGAIAYAEQNPQFPREASIGEVIDSYHHRLRQLEQLIAAIGMRLERAAGAEADKLLSQLEQVTDLYEAADGYAVSSRLNRSLEQLGLGSIARDTPVWNLSGGQRSRLALACVLSSGAQLLLLDEPTNDLDDDALRWLDAALQGHRGALVVVSHDRVFLQRYARRIVLVEDGAVKHYADGYQGFLRAKASERASAIAAFEHWTEELERSETLVAKNAARVAAIPRKQEKAGFGHGAFRLRSRAHGSTSKIRQAKARIEELESSPAPKPAEKLEFRLPSVANVDEKLEPLLQATDVARVNDPQIFVEGITVRPGERWLVGGANGAGKSTLLKVLAGELPVEKGEVSRRPDLRIGWLRQELSDLPGDTVIEAYAAALDLYLDEAVEQMFSLALFTPRDLLVHPRALSVGQRRRLELAIAVGKNVDLLLLDEPTNHLSPDLVEQLEEALVDYPGTVITVTHDRRWRNKLASHSGLKRLDVAGGVVKCEE
ncbi:ABC-F family ATP-binding cassette domain-containing protein [Glutamicibacter sp. NPDC087344]|uniref:ABC-F family ATP-binding cassette domain-containing protein n=1 Tax=Glutamicibacter sp. NPDC087344 TaxID=3363994 RepID=UPI0038300CF3